eukprot:gene8540-364_t
MTKRKLEELSVAFPEQKKNTSFNNHQFLDEVRKKLSSWQKILEFCEGYSEDNVVVLYFKLNAKVHLGFCELKELEKIFQVKTQNSFDTFILARTYEKLDNYIKAKELYSISANEGNAEAQNNLGFHYQFPKDPEDQDLKQAVYWYTRSSSQNNSSAQNNLGFCYKHGFGVKKDLFRGFSLFETAAYDGNPTAQSNLGICYLKGEGVQKNPQKALEWTQKSALQGCTEAQYNVALILETEYEDFEGAYDCYHYAYSNGNEEALEKLRYFEEKGLTFELFFKKNKMYLKLVPWDQGTMTFSDVIVYTQNKE